MNKRQTLINTAVALGLMTIAQQIAKAPEQELNGYILPLMQAATGQIAVIDNALNNRGQDAN